MTSRSIILAVYESSVLSGAGIPLVTGWRAIATAHREPDVISFFTDLADDIESGQPSLKPFEQHLPDDMPIASKFAELAANTTMYEHYWAAMAFALVLKKKRERQEPSDADRALDRYLNGSGDAASPEEWWAPFTIDQNRIEFPPTITTFLRAYLQSGLLDALPQMVVTWSRMVQVVEQL